MQHCSCYIGSAKSIIIVVSTTIVDFSFTNGSGPRSPIIIHAVIPTITHPRQRHHETRGWIITGIMEDKTS